MNIFEAMKHLKNMKEVMEEVKRELREEREILSKEGLEITFNGLGEIVDIKFPEGKSCEDLKEVFIELVNQAQDISRDRVKEAINRKFGGLLGGLGLGL
ncbi:MAG: hypothetical protein GXN96_05070 [Aquificae bacterium]|nr:hypothetical protein [Aquificota bacterium]